MSFGRVSGAAGGGAEVSSLIGSQSPPSVRNREVLPTPFLPEKTVVFFEFSLCLSGACLGKKIVSI